MNSASYVEDDLHAAAEKRDDGRYRAILIDAEAYFLSVVRYIHRNPVGGGSVRDMDQYR